MGGLSKEVVNENLWEEQEKGTTTTAQVVSQKHRIYTDRFARKTESSKQEEEW